MNSLELNIKSFNDKLQLLLKKHVALKKENEGLKEELDTLKEREVEYKFSLHELDQKVSVLKAASGDMAADDKKEFEKRINLYIREIDKCIGLLSD